MVTLSAKYLRVAAMSLVLTGGCATFHRTQAEIKFLETRELALPYERAFQAAADGLFSLGFSIEHSDKKSGILTGRTVQPEQFNLLKLPFRLTGLATAEGLEYTITLMLTRETDSITRLRMKVRRCGKPVEDRRLVTKVWQRIEREALLDEPPNTAARSG